MRQLSVCLLLWRLWAWDVWEPEGLCASVCVSVCVRWPCRLSRSAQEHLLGSVFMCVQGEDKSVCFCEF